jgi:hypothetical protein
MSSGFAGFTKWMGGQTKAEIIDRKGKRPGEFCNLDFSVKSRALYF